MAIKTAFLPGQFAWVDLQAHDLEAACQFYGQVLGWTSVPLDTQGGPAYQQFELDGKAVAGIGQMPAELQSQGMPPCWNSYVNVEQIETVVERARELGATIVVPVTKIVEAGWLAFLRDPTGGQIGLWQKNQHFGAQLVNVPGAFCWNELATRDVDRACQFYGQLLDWEFAEHPQSPARYYIIRNQGADNGGIMQMDEQWGEIPPHWTVYFSVDDAAATAAKVSKHGGHVFVPPFETPVGHIAVLADPQGATFNVIQLSKPAP